MRRVLALKYVRWDLVLRDDRSIEFLAFRRRLLVLTIHNTPVGRFSKYRRTFLCEPLTLVQLAEAQDSSLPSDRRIHS